MKLNIGLGLTLIGLTSQAQVLPPTIYWTNIANVLVTEACGFQYDNWNSNILAFSVTNVSDIGPWDDSSNSTAIPAFTITNVPTPCTLGALADVVFITWTWNMNGSFGNTNKTYYTNWGFQQPYPEGSGLQTTNLPSFQPYKVGHGVPAYWFFGIYSLDTNSDPSLKLQWCSIDQFYNYPPSDNVWFPLGYNNGWWYEKSSTTGPFTEKLECWRAHSSLHGTNGPVKMWYRIEDNLGNWF